MKRIPISELWGARFLGGLVLVLLLSAVALSQQPQPASGATRPENSQGAKVQPKAKPKPTFTLKVSREPILNISLKAEKAKLKEVAEALSKELKTVVAVAPALEQQLISIEFSELTLEPAMQLMAPEVYIDYEVNTSLPGPGKPLGIFFYPADQGEPPLTAVVQGNTQSMLIEGDTEEGVEPKNDEERKKLEEQPLRIQFEANILSIKAKKQPLPLVLLKVGEELGIPVDIEYQPTDIIDTEITKLSVEDAMRHLSPNILLFLRADLLRSERRALRLVLAEPAKLKPQGF